MAKITWSKYTIEALNIIHDFIARESPFYAHKTIEEFFLERFEALSLYPEIGREAPEYVRADFQ